MNPPTGREEPDQPASYTPVLEQHLDHRPLPEQQLHNRPTQEPPRSCNISGSVQLLTLHDSLCFIWTGFSRRGGLYLNAYEVSFPLEENMDPPPSYHLTNGTQMTDDPGLQDPPPHAPYSPFILVSNLRAHLYVALEKNVWMQKRIEELEEERNYLRCQLDRFIISMRSPTEQVTDWGGDSQRGVKVQPTVPPNPPSPMTTRSGMTLNAFRTRSKAPPWHRPHPRQKGEAHVTTAHITTGREVSSCGRAASQQADREGHVTTPPHNRQRVKDPDGVLIRYKKILSTYQRVRSMSRAFQIHGVDRNTMASTSPIAELLLVAPEKVADVGEFDPSKEKLLDYARRCYKTMDEQTHAKVQSMKKTHKLLPISYRFRN
ncbi:coiled-coil domain-containing protein 106-like [Sphaeramia orbicularis]|uniref:coiled-coil domain-containing protein 106-like n=1 Tax=Sphaeramia orbicularis TaxID=375764 RepID=UPI00117D57A5|nr:coiled-coil domain-containing protein 106-like [Sphaeramia orbicularis]